MPDTSSEITFIKRQNSKPYYKSSAITGMIPKLYFKTENKNVLIKDIRNLKETSLNKYGFSFHNANFDFDIEDIKNDHLHYKKSLKKTLKTIIDFKNIEIFDITRRPNSKNGAFNKDGQRQPAERAHVDYTYKSGPYRAKQVLEKKYREYNKNRIIQLNIWKPISDVVLSSPLAIADANSIDSRDLIATDQIFPDRVGEIYHLAYNPAQEWYWVSEMKKNELLIFKGWDSSPSKKIIKFTPLTSFNLKNQSINNFPRESIEARVFLII